MAIRFALIQFEKKSFFFFFEKNAKCFGWEHREELTSYSQLTQFYMNRNSQLNALQSDIILDFSVLPNSLEKFSLEGNNLSSHSQLNLTALPSSLTILSLQNNAFTGTLDFQHLSVSYFSFP